MSESSAKEAWFRQAKRSLIRIIHVGWSAPSVEVYVPYNHIDMLRQLPIADDDIFENYIVRFK